MYPLLAVRLVVGRRASETLRRRIREDRHERFGPERLAAVAGEEGFYLLFERRSRPSRVGAGELDFLSQVLVAQFVALSTCRDGIRVRKTCHGKLERRRPLAARRRHVNGSACDQAAQVVRRVIAFDCVRGDLRDPPVDNRVREIRATASSGS